MAKLFLGLYGTLVLGLFAAAAGIWRLRCEGFGCMGLGVAWFAWAIAFFVILGLGLLLQSQVAASAQLARLLRCLRWLQLALGAAHAAIWFAKNAV